MGVAALLGLGKTRKCDENICARRESPAVNFLTEISSGPGLAVFAFRCKKLHLKQKHRSGLLLPTRAKQLARSEHKFKNRPLGRFLNLRPAGVEPTFPASEADALSIELRARKTFAYSFYHIWKRLCLPGFPS